MIGANGETAQYNYSYIHHHHATNQLTDDKILDLSKLKQIADNILKCILNENKCHMG